MRRDRGWWAVGCLAGVAALIPARLLASVPPINRGHWAPGARAGALHESLACLGAWWLLFAVTVVAFLRAPRRLAVISALVLGALAGLASLAHTTVLSDDLYRYAWDGRVQAAGINPYRYPPNSPQLTFLHDRWLWPTDAECAARGKIVPCTRINRPGIQTIYPPVAQWWFLVAHYLLPVAARDLGWEALGLVLAVATGVLIALVLRRTGRDPRWVVLWSCCPLVAVEAVQSAHVDSLAALLLTASLAVLLGELGLPDAAGRGRTAAAAALLAAAGLVKLYPFVFLPALFRRHRPTAWLVVGGLTVLAYLPYLLGVGGGVTGSLRAYLQEEGYGRGGRFQLLTATGLPDPAVKVLAYAIVGAVLVLALLCRLGPPPVAALTVFVTLLLVATPGEPWYELPLVVLIAFTGRWQWFLLVLADTVSYLTAMLGGPHVPLTRGSYLVALVVGVGVTLLHRLAERQRRAAAPLGPVAERLP